MNIEELTSLYDNLSALVAQGKEDEAREYLGHNLARLPEDVKNQILGEMFFEAIVDEAQEIKAIANAQEKGISALRALETLKKEIEKEK